MANAYGRGAYGVNRYGGYAGGVGRPYGIGGYGTGPYSRYGAYVYDLQGRTGISFGVWALPRLTYQLQAVTGISFAAWAEGLFVTLQPAAVTSISFDVHAHGTLTWTGWAPCASGGWVAPGGCGVGTWTEARLT